MSDFTQLARRMLGSVRFGPLGVMLFLQSLIGCSSKEESGIKPDPGTGASANAGAAGTSASSRCPSKNGPQMVAVETPGGDTYCIDISEVSRSHYSEFLNANLKGKVRADDICTVESDYRPRWEQHYDGDPNDPDTHVGTCYMEDYHGDNVLSPSEPNKPMTCISWCQARAYCEWAGKRLCGRVGGGSVKIEGSSTEYSDAKLDEWYNACSQGGETVYSFGDTYVNETCGDIASAKPHQPETAIRDVKTSSGCTGTSETFDLIYDLSGNVAEWQNGCERVVSAGALETLCPMRGGSVANSSPTIELQCVSVGGTAPESQMQDVGFRCCAD